MQRVSENGARPPPPRPKAGTPSRLPGELTLENTPAHTKAITEDVIVSHGTSRRVRASDSREDKLAYTRVLVRRGGEWRLAANHVAEPTSQPDPRASRS